MPGKENAEYTVTPEDIITQLRNICHDYAVGQGFYDGEVNIPEKLCLIHSEVSEALEALRGPDEENNIGEELADIIIRVFDLAGHLDINIYKEITDKMEKNFKREYKHGKKF